MNKYKVIIIEDEPPAARRLEQMLVTSTSPVQVVGVADSVTSAVALLSSGTPYDLLLMDVQLGDGLSFEIWDIIDVKKPVIFCTAYDAYTLKAFKVNSIDYLLKPISQEDLNTSLEQFVQYADTTSTVTKQTFEQIFDQSQQHHYRKRFLVKKGKQLEVIPTDQIAYLYSEDGYTHIITSQGKKCLIDNTLDGLTDELDPSVFHRINRKMIVAMSAIASIEPYFNSRLKLQLKPSTTIDTTVSRDRVRAFKQWLDQ